MPKLDFISAKQNGVSFDEILKTVLSGRSRMSALSEDKVVLLDSMLCEVEKGVSELTNSIKGDDLSRIKLSCESLIEFLSIIKDVCDES